MEKFTFLKSEDKEIFILKKDYPRFLCRINTIIPFDISIIISDLMDNKVFDKMIPELKKFSIDKIKDLQL